MVGFQILSHLTWNPDSLRSSWKRAVGLKTSKINLCWFLGQTRGTHILLAKAKIGYLLNKKLKELKMEMPNKSAVICQAIPLGFSLVFIYFLVDCCPILGALRSV